MKISPSLRILMSRGWRRLPAYGSSSCTPRRQWRSSAREAELTEWWGRRPSRGVAVAGRSHERGRPRQRSSLPPTACRGIEKVATSLAGAWCAPARIPRRRRSPRPSTNARPSIQGQRIGELESAALFCAGRGSREWPLLGLVAIGPPHPQSYV